MADSEGSSARNPRVFGEEEFEVNGLFRIEPYYEGGQRNIKDYVKSTMQWVRNLEERRARLIMLIKAQGEANLELRKRKQSEVDHMTKVAEAVTAIIKLMIGYHTPEEKDELIHRAKSAPECEEMYKSYLRFIKKNEIMERIVEFQTKRLEELKVQHSKVTEELRKAKADSSWKRVFLSLYCARTEQD